MRNFQKRTDWKGFLQSKPVLAFLGILILFFAWGVIGFMNKMKETALNKRIVESKLAELEERKEKLDSNIAKLKTEKGTEEVIREKYGLVKGNENMILIVEDPNPLPVSKEKSGGFFSFFTNWFK